MTLGEGNTPLEASTGLPNLLFKREDLNPTGSHKDRAASYQLAAAHAAGVSGVVISSSGNAAIATSRYAALHSIPAIVVVHPETDAAKLDAIDGNTTTIIVTERAINTAKRISREFGYPNLRPSTNDDSIIGYSTLGDELAAEEFDDLVIFATSGATALGIARTLPSKVGLHVVQGEGNAGLVAPETEITSVSAHTAAAGRLGVRRSRRGDALRLAIRDRGGNGWVVDDSEVSRGRLYFQAAGINVSDESAANFAVAHQLATEGRRVVCIVSGAPAPESDSSPLATIHAVDEFAALDELQERVQ